MFSQLFKELTFIFDKYFILCFGTGVFVRRIALFEVEWSNPAVILDMFHGAFIKYMYNVYRRLYKVDIKAACELKKM